MKTDVPNNFKTTEEEREEISIAAKFRKLTKSAYLRMLHRREWKRIKREMETAEK